MRHLLFLLLLTSMLHAAKLERRPNVLVFYIDDMGHGQPGCYGGKLVPTPHMDALAAEGVRFTDGYVSACVCTPSRVGLLTGRYQARTGHDANTEGFRTPGRELLLSEVTMAQRLKAAGYTTGMIGKWHVGSTTTAFWPASRGFDEAFGSFGNLGPYDGGYFRGLEKIAEPPGAPVTTPLYAEEARSFIRRHQEKPWFLYLAFNAVHSPFVAGKETLQRFAHLPKAQRDYAAQISELDEAIGSVLGTLRESGLDQDTLVFCLSDNGGAPGQPLAEMGGLRGTKWLLWEGGIRVAWMVRWPGHIPPGRVIETPVVQLDVLPTALEAAGVPIQPQWQLDGVSLLPLLEGKTATLDREALYWRFGPQFAVRQKQWKLVKTGLNEPVRLFNLQTDRGEQHDLSAAQPEVAARLTTLWEKWNATLPPPRWEDHRWNDGNPNAKAPKAK